MNKSREEKMKELLKIESVKKRYENDKKYLAEGRADQNLKIFSKYFPTLEKNTVLNTL